MLRTIFNLPADLLADLAPAVRVQLQPDRAERWEKLLVRAKGLDKLSPFDFFDDGKRSGQVTWVQPKGWPALEEALRPWMAFDFIGLQWQRRAGVAALNGVCREFLAHLADHRMDGWLVFPGRNRSLITTHEGDYGLMTW